MFMMPIYIGSDTSPNCGKTGLRTIVVIIISVFIFLWSFLTILFWMDDTQKYHNFPNSWREDHGDTKPTLVWVIKSQGRMLKQMEVTEDKNNRR